MKNCLTYILCPGDFGQVDHPKDIIAGPFKKNEQNGSLNISKGYILGNDTLAWG